MNIIAHRGIHDNINIIENTIEAFEKAIKKNLPIELDVNITKDKKIVVFHDNSLRRLAHLNKRINNCTYTELKKVRLKNSKIPLLEEVLKLVNGKVELYIEIKNSKNYKETCELVKKILNNYKGKYYIQSFNYKIVKYFIDNNIESGLLITNNKIDKYYKPMFILKILLKWLNPSFISVSKSMRNKKINRLMKKYKTLIWTIDYKKESKNYKNKNIICNNLY